MHAYWNHNEWMLNPRDKVNLMHTIHVHCVPVCDSLSAGIRMKLAGKHKIVWQNRNIWSMTGSLKTSLLLFHRYFMYSVHVSIQMIKSSNLSFNHPEWKRRQTKGLFYWMSHSNNQYFEGGKQTKTGLKNLTVNVTKSIFVENSLVHLLCDTITCIKEIHCRSYVYICICTCLQNIHVL